MVAVVLEEVRKTLLVAIAADATKLSYEKVEELVANEVRPKTSSGVASFYVCLLRR